MWSHSTVGKAYRRAFARLGFDIKTSTHVLRRAAIDALREVASHVLIRKIVGHSSETYTELYSSAQKQEILLLAERLGGIVGQEVGNGESPESD
jgi:integrase